MIAMITWQQPNALHGNFIQQFFQFQQLARIGGIGYHEMSKLRKCLQSARITAGCVQIIFPENLIERTHRRAVDVQLLATRSEIGQCCLGKAAKGIIAEKCGGIKSTFHRLPSYHSALLAAAPFAKLLYMEQAMEQVIDMHVRLWGHSAAADQDTLRRMLDRYPLAWLGVIPLWGGYYPNQDEIRQGNDVTAAFCHTDPARLKGYVTVN